MYLDASVQDGHTADVLAASTHNQAGCGLDSSRLIVSAVSEPSTSQGQDLQASAATVDPRIGKYVCIVLI